MGFRKFFGGSSVKPSLKTGKPGGKQGKAGKGKGGGLRTFIAMSRHVEAAEEEDPSPDFDPTTISGCTLWLAVSNLTGFADGDPVGDTGDEFPNLGSAGGNFTEGTANRRATYQTNEVNTRPVLRFVNTPTLEADRLTGPNLSNHLSVSAFTVFAVVRPTIGGGTDASSRYYRRPPIIKETGSNFHLGLYNTTFVLNRNTTTGPAVQTPTFTVNQWYIVEGYFGSGTMGIKANNSTADEETSVSNFDSLANAATLGQGTDLSFDGDIAEIIAFNVDIGSSDRTVVRNALAAKYDITLA